MNPQPSHRHSTAGNVRQEGMCSNICRIYISYCHEAAEKWKKETSTDISRKEIHHLCCAGSSCALCLTVGNDCGPSACQGFFLVGVGLCPGHHEEPWAHRLMLLEARPGYTNPSLLGESHDTADEQNVGNPIPNPPDAAQQQTPATFLPLLFHVIPHASRCYSRTLLLCCLHVSAALVFELIGPTQTQHPTSSSLT